MGMKEAQVWREWLLRESDQTDRVGVNVPVWWNIPNEDDLAKEFLGPIDSRGDYRIDGIYAKEEVITIVEVKETGNMTAIGQLMAYEVLFERSYDGYKGSRKLLLCKKCPEAIKGVCEMYGIEVLEMCASMDAVA